MIEIEKGVAIMDYETVAERIDRLIASTGKENARVADAIGVTPTQVSHHRRAVGHPPGITSLEKYADYFNVSIDWILGRVSESSHSGMVGSEFYDLYESASEDDKFLIQTILKKYRK